MRPIVPRIALLAALSLLLSLTLGIRQGSSVRANGGGDDAPTFRMDPAHSGAQPADSLRPPLRKAWAVDLGGPVYFPLIVDGTVYVVAGNMANGSYANYGSRLYALSLADGHVIWGPKDADPHGTYYFSGLTYDAGRLFVASGSGGLRAIDPKTGADLWPQPAPVPGLGIDAQPTAVNGVVYVTAEGNQYSPPYYSADDANVSAFRESDGLRLWTSGIDSGLWSAPVVTANGVYVTGGACEDTWAFNPTTGAQLWKYQTGCYGGGGTTAALWQGKLYVRDNANAAGTILDPANGTALGHFPSRILPAFNGSTAFLLDQNSNNNTLVAWDVNTRTPRWTVAPPAGDLFAVAPVYVNGFVFEATRNGSLVAINASLGSLVWSGDVGTAITGTSNENNPDESTGISIGEGTLLLPVNTALVAYTSASARELSPAPGSSSTAHFRGRSTPPPPRFRQRIR
ncbi:MAG: PQQ-like beta-propeller repeat protein [Candidatus Dormibacteraeota bacterium]|nr:PQQ-like beta-propeller repeat protein [Candidatus Dormibacteraeota bacterium]